MSVRSPVSTIGVLPSSLPEFHKAYMKGQPNPSPQSQNFHLPPHPGQSEEERAAQLRRLRPHSRALPDTSRQRPEPMTAMPSKKPRPTKWQFGIRSRNQPAEAMLAIFKALKAMGADWEVPRIRKAGGASESRSRSGSRGSQSRTRPNSRSRSNSSISSSSGEEYEISDGEGRQYVEGGQNGAGGDGQARGRPRKHYGAANDWGYNIPEDPWVINARFRKDGMFPPGVMHPSSTHSSRADLQDPTGLRRRSSTNTSHSSFNHIEGITAISQTDRGGDRDHVGSFAGDSTSGSSRYPPGADEAVYIYVSIQLYSIDRDFFVVDFKCAGYERLVSSLVREIKAASPTTTTQTTAASSVSHLALNASGLVTHNTNNNNGGYTDGWDDVQGVWRRLDASEPLPEDLAREVREGASVVREKTEEVGAGRKEGEKRCTSPFPFLDVASSLILQLSGE